MKMSECGRCQDTDAILCEVYNAGQRETERKPYQLSENLETYFIAKAHKDEIERQEKGGNTI